ncbi:NAD(P)-dependent alcohol dehydrogenase [Sinorhizobium meliloti]|uniref:NAD(P)-dependent alcohol dehydrogenase n=1 Tax=Rhizobium meliloti TaxID=382 RepID=UPI000FD722C6|nr:NAD(P)-dependent alcohol dehydrogenase [Sinorhizobium meliloti]MDW9476801.1 alcohol dehydrogenase catalytic domain-containing protein [Sinorhizobium meliloti]MDW9682362.1 alcohol dehydrogenase catalytic domain-containing protein [Sinorhizobium meliloti]MDW9695554.1 alcohol dehydrogenase catalytic domain-containing protein [Sinorhizobium meliloti]MDW9720420.1 alcohol dehydrogenase catalytic domain-containing protein [Sinorhizobium meliloti]MDW9757635.1 alcohol dehydrogenase catalytic domain-
MKALVVERKGELALREIDIPLTVGPEDVKIAVHTVGICASDLHYYLHGGIGSYRLEMPMVLGHEASGVVVETGSKVVNLRIGDRVCMEPGVPNLSSRASKLGRYNVDPDVVFWATPPVHGALTPFVVHPAAFTYRLPPSVSFAEGAMVEPFAIGMQAATRAQIVPGDIAAVIGSGPIGIMTALAALAGGCSRVYISDLSSEKLNVAGRYAGIHPVNVADEPFASVISRETDGWGADIVFEASGNARAFKNLFDLVRPGGVAVIVGLPAEAVAFDVHAAVCKEVRIETVMRYANVFDRALSLFASGKVDLKPLITGTYRFADSVQAFERAASANPTDVKLQIRVSEEDC